MSSPSPLPWRAAMSTAELAAFLGIKVSTVIRWRSKARHADPDRYPMAVRADGLVFYPTEWVMAWLERRLAAAPRSLPPALLARLRAAEEVEAAAEAAEAITR